MVHGAPDVGVTPAKSRAQATALNDVVNKMSRDLHELYGDVTGHLVAQAGSAVEQFKRRFGYHANNGEDVDLDAPGFYPASVAVATTLSQIAGLLLEYANDVERKDTQMKLAMGG